MRKLIIATIALSFLAVTGAPAADLKETSSITTVTVYPDRAMVTREASVKLSSGMHRIVLENLPGALQDDSVRVWGKGSAKVRLQGMGISRQDLPQASDADIRNLENKIQDIADKLTAINQERYILDVQKKYLESLINTFLQAFNKGILSGNSAEAKLAGAQSLVSTRLSAIADKRVALDVEERELREEMARLKEELNRVSHPGQSQQKTLTVDVECVSGGTFILNFSYIMGNSGWVPVYDIRAESKTGKVEIVSKARIVQRTGEDWNKVELILSTAAPQVGGDMPEPQPLVLDFVPEYRDEGRRVGGGVMRKAEALPPPPPPPGQPMTTSSAEMISGETAVEYKVKTPRTITAEGKPYTVPVATDTFDGELRYMAIPIESPYAYLQAKVKNTSENSFLPGEAGVFLAGKFVGKASLPNWAPGEEIDVPLGIDEGITIDRKLISKKTDTSLGKTTVTYEWRIEVTSNLKMATTLRLFEPIPQSRHNDIDVKVTLQEPEPTEMEQGGKARWDLNLNPGAKVTIKLGYRVKYPSGRQIENLP